MAVDRKKLTELRAALRRASGAPKRVRRQEWTEESTIAWANEALNRLRRLTEWLERVPTGPRREETLRELDALRRASHWPAEDRKAERDRVNRREADLVKRVYGSVLPDVRTAKAFFSVYESLNQIDVDEHIADHPRLARIAEALGTKWTVALVDELRASKPSAWLIARLGEKTNYSDSTIKNLVHRRPRRSK